ncbi:MAG: trypsin-like serine protease, partial [Maricaulaceae bacterium]
MILRVLVLIAALAASLLALPAAAQERRLSVEEIEAFLAQARPSKPGAAPISVPPELGEDSCRWANDLECDEPGVGTGACAVGTDYSDCRYLREGEADDCRWARDGECDEPGFGVGVCVQGSDMSDCAEVAHLRFHTDTCASAFNGVCEERGTRLRNGPARCAPRTDRTDCFGTKRPLTIIDAFGGQDDRQLLDTTVYPWNAIGALSYADGSGCTGSLVAPDVVLTAAHCVYTEDGDIQTDGIFRTAVGRGSGLFEADVSAYLISPRFSYDLLLNSSKVDATDWAYLRLDAPAPADITP